MTASDTTHIRAGIDISREKLLQIYLIMTTIREFEKRSFTEVTSRQIFGGMHSSIGQEAVSAGIGANLTPRDYLGSTHRGHGHCIAKGVEPRIMMAELFGRTGGSNRGKGGSMHIAYMDTGMLGANAIVGASLPLAVGAALKAQYRNEDRVAVAFFGDGASNQGIVHESMNLAAIWKLPVLFVCENNLYAESTPVKYAVSVENIADRAAAYNMPGVTVDGMDAFAVYEQASKLIQQARSGHGPALLEGKTYRYRGHASLDNPRDYRTAEEEEYWIQRDPIVQFQQRVLNDKVLAQDDLTAIDQQVATMMDEAVTFADESPEPEVSELLTDVYVSYPERELHRGTGLGPRMGTSLDAESES